MTRTLLGVDQNPGGLFDVIDLNNHPGQVYFVHAGTAVGVWGAGSDAAGYGSHPGSPVASIDYAIGLCTAAAGDIIYVGPGHVETTTAIAADVSGITIIGLGRGRLIPALTATTAATDLINVSAANVTIKNIRLIGAASGVTALVDISAADCTLEEVLLNPAATPLMSVTLSGTSPRAIFRRCRWQVSANGPDCAIDVETSTSDYCIVEDCLFNAAGFGWDLGVIRADLDAAVGWLIKNCEFISCDTVAIDFNSSAGASGVDGLVANCTFIATAALTSIEDIIDVGRYLFKECYAHDITNVTTAAARVPLGTVS